jgi:uncharacterized OB-fold protein
MTVATMSTPYQERKLVAAEPNVENQAFADATRDGKLLIGQCGGCGEKHFYPRRICPFCHGDKVDWVEASGRGTVYTYSVTRKAGPIPFCIAYVKLAEGPVMLTNIVDCDLDAVRIGQDVKLVFKPAASGYRVPMFAPA